MKVKLYDKSNSEFDYEWINAPGIEYSALFIENPQDGLSSNMMDGISLKYMFNTSKSYGLLSLYKSQETDATISEFFMLGFGQDFYSRKLGSGLRKFLNFYTSINLGVYVANGTQYTSRLWFTNPYIGLEILKTKNFLLDTKAGYFLPYKDNRNLRGFLFNVGVNFRL